MMDVKYEGSRNKPRSLSNASGLSFSSIQRAISGETAPNLDTVEAIANAFNVNVVELLVAQTALSETAEKFAAAATNLQKALTLDPSQLAETKDIVKAKEPDAR